MAITPISTFSIILDFVVYLSQYHLKDGCASYDSGIRAVRVSGRAVKRVGTPAHVECRHANIPPGGSTHRDSLQHCHSQHHTAYPGCTGQYYSSAKSSHIYVCVRACVRVCSLYKIQPYISPNLN